LPNYFFGAANIASPVWVMWFKHHAQFISAHSTTVEYLSPFASYIFVAVILVGTEMGMRNV